MDSIMKIFKYSHCSSADANSTEFDANTKNPVVSTDFSLSYLFLINVVCLILNGYANHASIEKD